MNELHDMILAQAICDSLTARSTGQVYALFEDQGLHKVIKADRVFRRIGIIAEESTYDDLVSALLEYLEEVIENA